MMRIQLGIAAALALGAFALPSAAQAQDYRGYAHYEHGHRYDARSWREHKRWERAREREARREHRRWERAHRHHDHHWNPYR